MAGPRHPELLRAALWLLAALLVMTALRPGPGAAQPAGEGPVYRLEVAGLACPFCAYGIEKKLTRSEGVARVDIDIDAGVVRVTMEPGRRLEEARARRLVDEAGFTLRGFAREAADEKG